MALIEKFVSDPIKNNEWLKYEDCYQALAAMIELVNALKADFPEDFCSSLSIHADGSCNGLQHYAALGQDYDGGYEVNLVRRETPGDVYTKVAKLVGSKIVLDINDKNSKYHQIASFLGSDIKRKIVKQTVMTTVYGVTSYGAKKQIKKQLRDFYNFENDNDLTTASVYLSKLTLEAVEDLFVNAHKIKDWLINCSDKVTKTGQPMSWFSPMGLPIIQPYRKEPSGVNKIKTMIQYINVIKPNEFNTQVDLKKQASAFPPNFIHCLDSTHLMMTSERMKEKGYDFAAVHDSYWCHVRNFGDMNRFLREEFIAMQKLDPLKQLKESLEIRFPEISFDSLPEKGKLDIEKIIESEYFFS